MKTITCKAMGGMCDAPLSANTKDEMMDVGMRHIEAAHPDMAADIKKMPKDDPKMKEWQVMFDKIWADTPDNA